MAGCKHSVWNILCAAAALMLPRIALGEVGVCPPYSKTFRPDDPPAEVQAFINDVNLRPGGGTLILEPGDYGDLGDIPVTGIVCLRAQTGGSQPVLLDGQFAIEPAGLLTLRSLSRRAEESYRTVGLTVTVKSGGAFWADRSGLRWLANDGSALLSNVTFSGSWAYFDDAIRNTGFLALNRGLVRWPGAWGVLNDGGYALLEQVSVVQNGYSDEFDGMGGGILNRNNGVVELVGSTVSENDGQGGIRNQGGIVEVISSIVAQNLIWHHFSGDRDCNGLISDLGYNVYGPDGGCVATSPTSLEANPEYAEPSPDPDQVWSPELGAGSPAIDRVPLGFCSDTDMLGRARTDGNGDGVVACDAGALEFTGQGILIKSPPFSRDYGLVDLESDTALYVVFMSSAEFDPADVDPGSVVLGDTGAVPRGYNYTDRNDDGVLDLRLRYKLMDVTLVCGEQTLVVSAMTFDRESIGGELKLEVTGCVI